jgi:hypothetical protein
MGSGSRSQSRGGRGTVRVQGPLLVGDGGWRQVGSKCECKSELTGLQVIWLLPWVWWIFLIFDASCTAGSYVKHSEHHLQERGEEEEQHVQELRNRIGALL